MPISYYGIDYTNVRLIGSTGFKDPDYIVDNYFGSINSQVMLEREKYNFASSFRKRNYKVDLDMLADVYRGINSYSILTNSDYSMDKSLIDSTIQTFNTKVQEGLDFVIIIEK